MYTVLENFNLAATPIMEPLVPAGAVGQFHHSFNEINVRCNHTLHSFVKEKKNAVFSFTQSTGKTWHSFETLFFKMIPLILPAMP